MKRVLLTAGFIAVVLLVGIGIYNSKIPDLKVTYKRTEIDILKCPVSWDTLLSGKRWDYPATEELAERVNSSVVEPGATLNLSFTRKPANFEVRASNGLTEKFTSDANGFGVPEEKGTYIYEVLCHWDKGTVMYIIKVEVK